ncbi:peptidoglycan-binding protein [Sorangium sp. So ce118]
MIDEIGEPVGGLDIVFSYAGKRGKRTTSVSGRVRLEPVDASFASASMASVQSARDLMKPRWDTPRAGQRVKPAEDVLVWHLCDEAPSIELQSESPRTVSIQPCVARARLVGGFFDTSKCFLLPNGVEGIRGVVRTYSKHRSETLLLVGHTDTAGDPSYNDPLSLERAEATAAYLTDDVDGWYKWYGAGVAYEKRWGTVEDQLMIDALPDAAERPRTESRVRWFQRTRGLKVDGIAGEETRRALIGEYMALDETSLPGDIEVVTHGCGENFPHENAGDGVADPNNRRIEIFFFKDKLGVQPKPSGRNSAKGSREYPEWVARAGDPIDFSTEDEGITLELEWAQDVVEQLPEDVSVVLSGRGIQPQKHFLALAERAGGVVRISFTAIGRNQLITLTAKQGDQQLVLVRDQLAGDLEEALVWEHYLEELLVVQGPDDGELVATGGPPEDTHEEPAPGEVLVV